MKAKDLILMALVCANVSLLAVGLILHLSRNEPAAMAATSSRAGDYVMVTGQIARTREGVLIIDVVAKRALFYAPKAITAAGAQWELTGNRDLKVDFPLLPPGSPSR